MARQRASQQAQAAFSRVGSGYVPPAADDQKEEAWDRDAPAPVRSGRSGPAVS